MYETILSFYNYQFKNRLRGREYLFELFSLSIIVLIALCLRLTHLQSNVYFAIDGDRDILVGKHLIQDKIITKDIRPYANGGNGLLKNSSVYFYAIGIVHQISRSPEGVTYFFVFASLIGVVCLYFLGRESHDASLGLIFAFTLSIFPYFVISSQRVFQPIFTDIFFPIFIYCLYIGYKKSSLIHQVISQLIFFFLIQTHLMLLSMSIQFELITLLFIVTSKNKVWNRLTIIFSQILGWCCFFYFTDFSIINLQSWAVSHSSSIDTFHTLSNGISGIINNVIYQSIPGRNIVALIVFLIFIYYTFNIIKKRNGQLFLLLFFLLCAAPITFPLLNYGYYYLGPYILLFMLCLIIIEYEVLLKIAVNKYIRFIILLLTVTVMFFSGILNILNTQAINSNDIKREIATDIINYLKSKYGQEDLETALKSTSIVSKNFINEDAYLNWNTPGYWYYIEKLSQMSIVTPCESEYNICISGQKRNLFIICQKDQDCFHLIKSDIGEKSSYFVDKLSLDIDHVSSNQSISTIPLESNENSRNFIVYYFENSN